MNVSTDCSSLASFSAFCRNYGDHNTPKARRHNWNEEAMKAMVQDMTDPWHNFQVVLNEERGSEIVTSIQAVMDWAVEYLGMLSREVTGLSGINF